jgi:predicted HNH restriction endonuclease
MKLEIHFLKPLALGGDARSSNLILLCRGCHDKVHRGARILGSAAVVFRETGKEGTEF